MCWVRLTSFSVKFQFFLFVFYTSVFIFGYSLFGCLLSVDCCGKLWKRTARGRCVINTHFFIAWDSHVEQKLLQLRFSWCPWFDYAYLGFGLQLFEMVGSIWWFNVFPIKTVGYVEGATWWILYYPKLWYSSVYFPEEVKETVEEDRKTPSPKDNELDDDYLGENVNYDIHE